MTRKINNVMRGLLKGYECSGAPTNGTSQVDTITFAAITGGTFRLAFQGLPTAAISWSAVNADLIAAVDAALEALPNIGAGEATTADSTLVAGLGDITVTWSGNCGTKDLTAALTVYSDALTGGGHSVSVASPSTTPGVTNTCRGAALGALMIRTDNGDLYQNAGTPPASTWAVV